MPECGYYSRFVARTPYGADGELHYVYELDSNEVVFGCQKGVKDALIQMSKEGAQVIAVILTCVPSLIGEDMTSIIHEAMPQMGSAKAVFIDGAHFKRNGYQSGFSDMLAQLVGILEPKAQENQKIVNFLGAAAGEEYRLFKELLTSNGYHVQEYSRGFSMDEWILSVQADLSIVWNARMLKAAQMLQELHGVPSISMASAYLPEDITQGYHQIAAALDIQDEWIINKQKELTERMRQFSEQTAVLSYVSVIAEVDILAVSVFLCALGLIPELLHVEEFDSNSVPLKEKIKAFGVDPYVTYISDPMRTFEAFEDTGRLFSLGNLHGLPADRQIPHGALSALSGLCGFERSSKLLDLLSLIRKEES